MSSSISLSTSIATKIENGPKTNTKIFWFLKIDQRIFVNSKILQRSSKKFWINEDSSYSSSVHFQKPKNLRIRLRSIFNLRCNTDLKISPPFDNLLEITHIHGSTFRLERCGLDGHYDKVQKNFEDETLGYCSDK